MTSSTKSQDLILKPLDNQRLNNLCGQLDEHLRQIERRLGVEINNRGNVFCIIGEQDSIIASQALLKKLYSETSQLSLTPKIIHEYLQESE
ncbi:MAG: phosphate starvation-inducible protein PhoH, partial [Thiohalomonadales bacterium]